jgi:hypothetical protein
MLGPFRSSEKNWLKDISAKDMELGYEPGIRPDIRVEGEGGLAWEKTEKRSIIQIRTCPDVLLSPGYRPAPA